MPGAGYGPWRSFRILGAGFNIAMQDLDIRGAGNLLGAEQSGFIADMGFETYQKILAEAVAELRAEGVAEAGGLLEGGREREGTVQYLTDAQIETDIEALLPDDYIGQSAEAAPVPRTGQYERRAADAPF